MNRVYKKIINDQSVVETEIFFIRTLKGNVYSCGISILYERYKGVQTKLNIEANEIISNDELGDWSKWKTIGEISIGDQLMKSINEIEEKLHGF